MDVHIISVKEVESYRSLLLPYIESFVERAEGRYDVEDVFSKIREEHWYIWVVHENSDIKAVLLTQIVEYPKLYELQIIMCVGVNHEDWYFLINKIEDYARLIGCKKLTAITRPGWKKVMKEYRNTHIYLERDL